MLRSVLLVAELAAVAAIAAAILGACGGPTAPSGPSSSAYAAELTPATLVPTPTPGETSTFRVRVYADDKHRAQILGWERKVSVMLRRASAVLGPTAGVELEIVDTRQWTRRAEDMDAMLAELEDLDPGGDVHLVLGLIDALPGVSSTIHQLGVARPLGKHIIMRGLNDAKEVGVLEAALEQISKESRDQLYSLRGKHKLTLVFLHEFGHALGAIHVREELFVLAPVYDVKQAAFSRENAALMRIAASFRAKASASDDRTDELKTLAAHIDGVGSNIWIDEERALVRKAINERISGAIEGGAGLSELSEAVRPDHRKLYRDAIGLADQGKSLEAWEKTEPLIDFYPDEPAVSVLACRLASARGLAADQVKRWCERAAELAPADITPTLTLALADINASGDARSRAKNTARAAALLAEARTRLLGVEGEHDDAWLKLAEAYQKLGLVSLAADAAGRSKDGGEIATWAQGQVAKYSVPPLDATLRKTAFPPALDGEYVAAVKETLKLVYARSYAKAQESATAADKRFGRTPGIEAARCDLEIRRRSYKAALRHCERALGLFEAGSWSHYLTGLLHKQAKRQAKAIKHLERSIDLDPTLRHAYEILAGLYDEAGRAEQAKTLRDAYKKRFGAKL